LLSDLRALIEEARRRVAQKINTELVMLNWQIGTRIRRDILLNERAEYGSQVLERLGKQLTQEYGSVYDRHSLARMVKFAELFPVEQIVATLSPQLGWSHFKELLPIDNELNRNFYEEMCLIEGWSVRTLKDKMKRILRFGEAGGQEPTCSSIKLQ
jgi:hypothetical protein